MVLATTVDIGIEVWRTMLLLEAEGSTEGAGTLVSSGKVVGAENNVLVDIVRVVSANSGK